MKFEANIPSYLRTGQGVFPVKAKGTAKTEEVVDLSQVKSALELLKKAGVQLGS